MVKIIKVPGSDSALHKKCVACKGAVTDCYLICQCDNEGCDKIMHKTCLRPEVQKECEADPKALIFCSETCQSKHYCSCDDHDTEQSSETNRWKEELRELRESNVAALESIRELREGLASAQEQNKTLRAQLQNLTLASSTRVANLDSTIYGTAAGDNFNVSALHDTIRRSAEQVRNSVSVNAQGASQSSLAPSNPDPLFGKDFSSQEASHEHAKTAYLLSLKEIRKSLGELPEFEGKGYEFLNFKNKFKSIREVGKYTDTQMVAKLEKSLKGRALDHVRLWLYSPHPNLEKIMEDLEDKFYHPNLIIQEALNKVLSFDAMKKKNREQLENFKRLIDSYLHICTTVKESIHLGGRIPGDIEDKLPDDLCEDWLKHVDMPISNGSWFEFSAFLGSAVKFLKVRLPDVAKASQSKPQQGQKNAKVVNVAVEQTGNATSSNSNSHSNNSRSQNGSKGKFQRPKKSNRDDSQPKKVRECLYDQCGKPIYQCPEFIKRKHDVKLKFCQDFNLCSKCLNPGHDTSHCPFRNLPKCKVEGCTSPDSHSPAMHPPECDARRGGSQAVLNNCQMGNAKELTLFQVAPTLIHAPDGSFIETTSFMDSGSNPTIMDQDLADELGIKGEPYNLAVEWCAGGVKYQAVGCQKVELTISPANNPELKFLLKNVITMKNLLLPEQEQNEENLKRLFPHLKDIKIPEFKLQRPKILIGLQHRRLCVPTKVVLPPADESSAIAELTSLGWVISVVLSSNQSLNSVVRSPDDNDDEVSMESLHELVKKFINLDISSSSHLNRECLSLDDQRAVAVQKATMKKVDDRYEVGFYWKSDDVQIPNNFDTALKRLKSTEATLKKKNLVDWSISHHQQLFDLGFARKATPEELYPDVPHKRVNYMIGFVVINQNKIPPKPRWVVDPASKHNGVSLNSALLKGPDNIVPLLQALFHFRERKYAVAADVEKMFHQMRVNAADQQCQRFLWRDCDLKKDPQTYIYTVMLFGPSDSPSKANAVRIEHATERAEEYPMASRAALDSMYVDDLFDSQDTIEDAVVFSYQAIKMFSEISWNITDFRSNCAEILAQLPSSHVNQNLMVELLGDDITSVCKVLGIYWNPKRDTFQFRQTASMSLKKKTLEESYRPTKRDLLSFIMRIYDCLGLISHFIIRGRMILQMAWKEQSTWDEPVSDEIFEAWKSWLLKFDEILMLEIPRHYGYDSTTAQSVQQHVFTDAGRDAYAAVSYLRIEFSDGEVHVVQVFSKARVAPLKYVSIPRMELKGALLGSQIAQIVTEKHKRLKINETYYWTDSETVLKWIYGFHLNLVPFVAPRVSEIRENTVVDNWRYCPSKENPADEATKWNDINFSDPNHKWFKGPPFLYKNSNEWPAKKIAKSVQTLSLNQCTKLTPKSLYYAGIFKRINPSFRAKWSTYTKVVAIAFKFFEFIKMKLKGTNISKEISPTLLHLAEEDILRRIQMSVWPQEYTFVSRGRALNETHSQALRNLILFVGDDKLIRVRSRMSLEVSYPYDMRNPILLPNSHETVDSIIRQQHQKNLHIGIDTTVAQLRERFWILRAKQAVKRISAKCLTCKELRARPYSINMGPLPSFRLTPTSKAFERVGCDVFGPFLVHVGRSKQKKEAHVVIFTCLVTRAVYLKRLFDLTTDDMLVAIQELWTRRGPIRLIMSDQGRNFIGCRNILSEELKSRLATDYSLKWKLNPAYTPQWGGTWERLIKDCKRALKSAIGDSVISERVFDTILLQVEDIMNCRPLTDVPASPDDQFPITPNILMKLHPGYSFIDDVSQPGDQNCRIMLKRARHLSNKFMSRWTKEHLPVITRASQKGQAQSTIVEGDYVIYCDPTLHPSKWPRGIVINVFRGRDGRVRLADIKLKGGDVIEKRSFYRLAKLDIADEAFQCSFDDTKNPENLEKVFVNLFRASTLNGHRGFKTSYVNVISAERKHMAIESDSNLSKESNFQFAKAIFTKLAKMLKYTPLNRSAVTRLLSELKFKKFYDSKLIKESRRCEVERIKSMTSNKNYDDPHNDLTVKLESDTGDVPLIEIILSLAAHNLQPRWITARDISQRKFVAFVMLKTASDADLLIDNAFLEVTTKRLRTSRPMCSRSMPIEDERFEHAQMRWAPRENTEWNFIISRHKNFDKSRVRAILPLGSLWNKRFELYFDEVAEDWNDGRVSKAPTNASVTESMIHNRNAAHTSTREVIAAPEIEVNSQPRSKKRVHFADERAVSTISVVANNGGRNIFLNDEPTTTLKSVVVIPTQSAAQKSQAGPKATQKKLASIKNKSSKRQKFSKAVANDDDSDESLSDASVTFNFVDHPLTDHED